MYVLKTCFLSFVMLISAAIMAQTEDDKRVEFGKQVFKCFQTNDFTLYRSLYPNFEEYKQLMQEMVNAKVDGLTQDQMNGFLDDYKREADSAYHAEFIMLQKQADSL